jgi:quinohemoprotein ethanol dehydrogenase
MLFFHTYRKIALLTTAALVAGSSILLAQKSRQVDDTLLRTGSKTGDEVVAYGVNWAEQRYSPLKQIDASNVSRLGIAWSTEIPVAPGNAEMRQEETPLVFNGVLYGITPWSVVYAVDLHTRKEIWRVDPEVNHQVWQSRICCGVVNRGIALYEGKVIAPVIDGRLRALDASSGKILWETRVSPENMAYTITMAPRVIKGGRIIIGVSGGEYAIRGFFSAYDVKTGKLDWRFYTVPGDPSKPFEHPDLAAAAKTWSNDWWKISGGAAVWNGMAYDAEHDIVYVGTGQPGPWTDVYRGPGDNLYSNCIVAVRGSTGKLVWYYQEVPGDDWDYDSTADLMLLDLKINGKNRQVIIHAPKSGFFYVLDRVTGEFISADPITKISWATGIDPKTGKPNVSPDARYRTTAVNVMPGPRGGHAWEPWSYSPLTGLVYFPGTAGSGYIYRADPNFVAISTDLGPTGRGRMNLGTAAGSAAPRALTLPTIGPDGPTGNVLYAWDPVAGKEKWRAPGGGTGAFAGGALATGGNLVFSSVNSKLLAFRADTGEKLLELDLGTTQMGPPISFTMDGMQYVAVTGGGQATQKTAHLLILALDGKAAVPGLHPEN